MAESEELKSLLMKAKEESEKIGLKLTIKKTKIMASGPLTSWWIDGETVEKDGLKLNIQKTKIMAFGPMTSPQIHVETVSLFLGAPKSLQMVTAAMKLKDACSLEGKLWPT